MWANLQCQPYVESPISTTYSRESNPLLLTSPLPTSLPLCDTQTWMEVQDLSFVSKGALWIAGSKEIHLVDACKAKLQSVSWATVIFLYIKMNINITVQCIVIYSVPSITFMTVFEKFNWSEKARISVTSPPIDLLHQHTPLMWQSNVQYNRTFISIKVRAWQWSTDFLRWIFSRHSDPNQLTNDRGWTQNHEGFNLLKQKIFISMIVGRFQQMRAGYHKSCARMRLSDWLMYRSQASSGYVSANSSKNVHIVQLDKS